MLIALPTPALHLQVLSTEGDFVYPDVSASLSDHLEEDDLVPGDVPLHVVPEEVPLHERGSSVRVVQVVLEYIPDPSLVKLELVLGVDIPR